MKISKTFVKWFLLTFVLVVLANVITPFFGVWNYPYLVVLMVYFMTLFFLIYRKQDNGTVKFFKFLVLLIPIIILGYVFYANFVASHDFNYFYDIGGPQDAKKPYLTPLNRVSEIDNSTNVSYRNLTSALVYFEVNVPRDSNNVTIQVRLFDNFPKLSTVSLGGKNEINWSYYSKSVYNNTLRDNVNGNWTVLNVSFNLKDLYISNGKLSILILAKNLNQNAAQNYTIPIDWINVTIHKDGLFKISN